MPEFKVHTKEIVHGIYVIDADTWKEAEERFNEGLSGSPWFTESVDAEVTCVEEKE